MKDKEVLIIFKDGSTFVTNKSSCNTTNWGITAVGTFKQDNEQLVVETEIPWTSIHHVEKTIS